MRKRITRFFISLLIMYSGAVSAMLNMELTRGVTGAVPIAIVPFVGASETVPQDLTSIITNDLKNSGRFKVYNPTDASVSYLKSLGADNVVTGKIESVGINRFQVRFELKESFKGKTVDAALPPALSETFVVPGERLRPLAHHISDMIYYHVLGIKGVFSTRLVYILVQRHSGQATRYVLEISDQDGYDPRPLLTSTDPIMSPSWSPDGKKIAYVSFENKRPSVFIQEIASGARQKVSSFNGINGAPAWSPDGKKLALVLSKDGTPNIYVLDLATKKLTRVTNDWSINTEPAWSPSGKSILFTSNRSGGPQVYQQDLSTGKVSRVTFEGNYNARASYTSDGNSIVVLNRDASLFNIGILSLDTGVFRVLTSSSGTDNESPSVAPNGSMVLYGTLHNGRSILAMAATDGSVQIRLPAREGEVQDPAWSPFLT